MGWDDDDDDGDDDNDEPDSSVSEALGTRADSA